MRLIDTVFQRASELAIVARDQGATAFTQGRSIHANPYRDPEDFYRHSAWDAGWRAAALRLVRAA